MTWKPTEDVDREIRRWMKAKGWEVNSTDYHFAKAIYACRHEVRGGHSPTLRIRRTALEEYPGFAVVELLERLNAVREIRARPQAQLVLVQRGPEVVLEELPAE